jgi:UDP-3-O-[3-hydroxymyristoyl] glucosamine N-acyltransferase
MKFSQVVSQLSVPIHSLNSNPDQDPDITQPAPLKEATSGTISYIEGTKFSSWLAKTAASALILPQDEKLQIQAADRGIAWISTPDPRLLFAQVIGIFYQPYRPQPEIHPTAVIHPTVKLGNDVYIGPYVVIQPEVEIGDNVVIHPHVVIYPQAKIGDRTTLHAHCTIHERSQIGADCVIHSGAAIGAEGFGFVPTRTGWFKMEQSGCTILADGVEIGCNSAVDRPSVGETRVGSQTKIDNLVQIGHGSQIGSGCAIAGQAGMAGGVTLGNRVILAGQSGIANQVTMGDGAIASAQAGVHNDIAPGEIVSGSPAVPHKLYVKIAAIYRRLPEMYQLLKKIPPQLRE